MIDDITKRLQLKDYVFLKSSFNRKNLSYGITNKKPKTIILDIIKFIKEKHANKTGIVYCLSRKTCEKVAIKLREGGLIARHYHAGLSSDEKDIALNEWRSGRCNIIVATVRSQVLHQKLLITFLQIAFGMGIDKPDGNHWPFPWISTDTYQRISALCNPPWFAQVSGRVSTINRWLTHRLKWSQGTIRKRVVRDVMENPLTVCFVRSARPKFIIFVHLWRLFDIRFLFP